MEQLDVPNNQAHMIPKNIMRLANHNYKGNSMSLNDVKLAALGSAGYNGGINDREYSFYANGVKNNTALEDTDLIERSPYEQPGDESLPNYKDLSDGGEVDYDGDSKHLTLTEGFIQTDETGDTLSGIVENVYFDSAGDVLVETEGKVDDLTFRDIRVDSATQYVMRFGNNGGVGQWPQTDRKNITVTDSVFKNVSATGDNAAGILSYDYYHKNINTYVRDVSSNQEAWGFYMKSPHSVTYGCTAMNITSSTSAETIAFDIKGSEIGGTAPFGTGATVAMCTALDKASELSAIRTETTANFEIESDWGLLLGNSGQGSSIAAKISGNINGSQISGLRSLGEGTTPVSPETSFISGSVSGSNIVFDTLSGQGYHEGITASAIAGQTLENVVISNFSLTGTDTPDSFGIDINGSNAGAVVRNVNIETGVLTNFETGIRLRDVSDISICNVTMTDLIDSVEPVSISDVTNVKISNSIARQVQTTTGSALTAIRIPVGANGTILSLKVKVTAKSGTEYGDWELHGLFSQAGGTVSQVGATTVVSNHQTAGVGSWGGAALSVSSNDATIRVDGAGATTVDWNIEVTEAYWV